MVLRKDVVSVAYHVKPCNLVLFAGLTETKEEMKEKQTEAKSEEENDKREKSFE